MKTHALILLVMLVVTSLFASANSDQEHLQQLRKFTNEMDSLWSRDLRSDAVNRANLACTEFKDQPVALLAAEIALVLSEADYKFGHQEMLARIDKKLAEGSRALDSLMWNMLIYDIRLGFFHRMYFNGKDVPFGWQILEQLELHQSFRPITFSAADQLLFLDSLDGYFSTSLDSLLKQPEVTTAIDWVFGEEQTSLRRKILMRKLYLQLESLPDHTLQQLSTIVTKTGREYRTELSRFDTLQCVQTLLVLDSLDRFELSKFVVAKSFAKRLELLHTVASAENFGARRKETIKAYIHYAELLRDTTASTYLFSLAAEELVTSAESQKALAYIRQARKRWGESATLKFCGKIEQAILLPRMQGELPVTTAPEKNIPLGLNVRNVDTVVLRLLRVNHEAFDYNFQENLNLFEEAGSVVEERVFVIPNAPEAQDVQTLFNIGDLELGNWRIMMQTNASAYDDRETVFANIRVASTMIQTARNGRFVLTDIESGRPIPHEDLQVFSLQRNTSSGKRNFRTFDLSTDADGIFVVDKEGLSSVYVLFEDVFHPLKIHGESRSHQRTESNVYTDNVLYRPGDTIHFAIQRYTTDGHRSDVSTPITEFSIEINGIDVPFTIDSTSQLYGVTWGFVVAPQKEVGRLVLSGEHLYSAIQVADYRPPKFALTGAAEIEVISQDSVMLHIDGTLESFSGLSTAGAEVVCSGSVAGFSSGHSVYDTLTADSDGSVHVSKLFVRNEDKSGRWYWLRGSYSLSYTSPYGELVEHAGTAWYGSKRSLEVNVPEWVNRDVETELTIAITGRTDSLSVFAGSLNISALKTPVRFKRESFIPDYADPNDTTNILMYSQQDLMQQFPQDDILETGNKDTWSTKSTAYYNDFVLTGNEVGTHTLRGLAPGWYRYEVIPRELGELEKQTGYFRVFGNEATENVYPGVLSVAPVNTECLVGGTAILDISTQVDKVYVMQEVVFNNKVVKRHQFELRGNTRDNVHRVSLPVPERFRGGFSVVTHTVYNERLYTDVMQVQVDWEKDNPASVSIDKQSYEPADTAIVTLHATKPGHVLHRVYDKANASIANVDYWFGANSLDFDLPLFGSYYPVTTDNTPWSQFVIPVFLNTVAFSGNSLPRVSVKATETIQIVTAERLYDSEQIGTERTKKSSLLEVSEADLKSGVSSPPRRPVEGWTYWYCDSITDSLTIRVPLPDNIATYVVEAVVISPDLSAGRATAEVSVNLPAMVEVQVPRVLRAGDEIAISGTASLLDSAIQSATVSGTVDVVVFDTQTSQPDTLNIALKKRAFDQGESTRLLWNVTLPSSAVSMEYDISVTDGNRQLDRVQRTQTVEPLLIEVDVRQAFVVGADDSLNFSITSPRKLTDENSSVLSNGVRVTSQPLVYVARALPKLQFIEFRNSVALTSQAVAAGLQQKLQEKFPSVVTAAAQAPSRSKNLRMFDVSNEQVFNADLNCDSLIEASLDELSSLQKRNGSFSWFHGGDRNTWTTLFVATNLRYMQDELGIDNSDLSSMLEDATEYCVEYLRSDSLFSPTAYTSQSREYFVRNNLIHFLAFESEIRATKDGDRHMQRVLDLLRAKWRELSLEELGIYGVLVRNTDATLANEILQLIDSKTTTVDNFGTTWEQTSTWKSRTIFGHNNVLAFLEHVQPNHKNIGPGYSWLLSTMRTTQLHNHSMLFVAKRLFTYYGDVQNAHSRYTLRVDEKTVIDGEVPRKHTSAFEDITIDSATVRTTNQIEFTNHANNDMWVDSYRTLITSEVELDARGEHVQVSREITVERFVDGRLTTLPYDSTMTLQASDKIKCNLTITTSIPLSFVHAHNPRPQAFEPLQQISGFKWEHRLRYYEAVKNEGTHMFVTDITPGTYTITDTWQTRFSGTYAMPPVTIQCEYAPEYNGASVGETVKVNLEE